MSSLINIFEFQDKYNDKGIDPRFYFIEGFDISKKFKSDSYPETCAMNRDRFKNYPSLIINIRRFVERSLSGDVILSFIDNNYRVLPPPDCISWYPIAVRHGYYKFNFEDVENLIMFKFKFSEYIDEILDRNPKFAFMDDPKSGYKTL